MVNALTQANGAALKVHSGLLVDQVIADMNTTLMKRNEAGGALARLSRRSAMRAVYLASLSEKGRNVEQACQLMRLKPETVKRMCRLWSLPLADYQPREAA